MDGFDCKRPAFAVDRIGALFESLAATRNRRGVETIRFPSEFASIRGFLNS